ncbi:Vacuolar protein 8 [Mortierella alpina]|nr:Vacuolar protein 8 [Mortierella alpina]
MHATTVQTTVLATRGPQDLSSIDNTNEHISRKLRHRAPAELINDNEFYTDIGGPINKARLVLNPHEIVDDTEDHIDNSTVVILDASPSIPHTSLAQSDSDFSQQKHLLSLSSLACSDQVEHQRAAAIGYHEYTRQNKTPSDTGIVKAILRLLKSSNTETQKSSLKAALNALESHDNANLLVNLDGLAPLNQLLGSPHTEIALDAIRCINLVANENTISAIIHSVDVARLLCLSESPDQIMQRSATEALRSYTLTAEGREAMVNSNALLILSHLLSSSDTHTTSCSVAAIKNIVEDNIQRARLLHVEPRLIPALVGLLSSADPNIQHCSAACLEILAENSVLGSEIIEVQGLTSLVRTTMSDHTKTVLAAVGCIFNLAANRVHHRAITDSPLVFRLGDLLDQGTALEVRIKAAGALRSLQELGEEFHKLMLTSGVARRISAEVLEAPVELQVIMSESLLQLTSCADVRPQLLEIGLLSVLITLSSSENKSIKDNSSKAIFNLAQRAKDFEPFMNVWDEPSGGLNGFLFRSLSKKDKTLQYLGLSILLELLQQRSNKELRRMVKGSPEILSSRAHLRPLKGLDSKDGLHYALIVQQVIRLLK